MRRRWPFVAAAVAALACGPNGTGPTAVPNAPSGWAGDFSTIFNFVSDDLERTVIAKGVAWWAQDAAPETLDGDARVDTSYRTTAGGGMSVTYRDVMRGTGTTCTGFGQRNDVVLGPADGQLTLRPDGSYRGVIRRARLDIPYTVTCTVPSSGVYTARTSIQTDVEFRLDIEGTIVRGDAGLRMTAAPRLVPASGVTLTNGWDFVPTTVPPL